MEGKAQSSHTHNPNIYQPAGGFTNHDVDGMQLPLPLPLPAHLHLHGRFASPTAPRNRDPASTACLPSRRVVSGSFGSFDGARAGRFDERPYRLLQKRELGSANGCHGHGFEEQLSSPLGAATHQHADSLRYTTHSQSPTLVQSPILPSQFLIPLDPRRNKLVSGSFGSFSETGPPSRFDERAYRLLSGQMQGQAGQSEGENGGEGEDSEMCGIKRTRPDPFKGKKWLR